MAGFDASARHREKSSQALTMFRRPLVLSLIAIIASGLMVAALFPPFSISLLAWICMIPLLIALWSIDGKHRAKKGFIIGYAAGAISFGIQISWLATVSWLGPIVLAGYLAIYWGIFGAFAATIGNPWHQEKGITETPARSLFNAFTHAAIFAGLEVIRGWVFTGFGWNGLGVAFHETLAISQAADLLGVAGLTLMLVFFQAVIVQCARRLLRGAADGKRTRRWDFTFTAVAVGVLLGYGIIKVSLENAKPSIPLKALLVQINIPHEGARVLWPGEQVHFAYEEETLKALKNITDQDEKNLQEAMQKSTEGEIELNTPDWVLWPETALNGRLLSTPEGEYGSYLENLETISRVREPGGNFKLIYGAVEIEGEAREDGLYQKENARIFNSIVIEDNKGDIQTFRKHHLVIFGETIPLLDTFPFLQSIYEQQSGQKYYGSFSAGESLNPLEVDLRGETIQVIPSVCFEDTVPRLTRKFIRSAPQIIVNLTNDGWFKTSPAAAQHFANARFRAIELRRPMLRCANTGVSAAISTVGSTVHPKTGINQAILDENGSSFLRNHLLTYLNIPLNPTTSLYSIIGDWGILLLFAAAITLSLMFPNQKPLEEPSQIGQSRRPKSKLQKALDR
ncbi:MAG: apolipoprotein N-acyltransferase [Akkermansiaceae bacterium]